MLGGYLNSLLNLAFDWAKLPRYYKPNYDIHAAHHSGAADRSSSLLPDVVALNPGQNQPVGQDHAQRVQIIKAQMGSVGTEIILFLQSMQ